MQKNKQSIHVDIQDKFIEAAMSGVSIMLAKKMNNFISLIGSMLIVWYSTWLVQVILLIFSIKPVQMNTPILYIAIDLMTFAYFFYSKYYDHYFNSNVVVSFISKFIIFWFGSYTIIDVTVPTWAQPNTTLWHCSMFILCSTTLGLIIFNEIRKNKIQNSRLGML